MSVDGASRIIASIREAIGTLSDPSEIIRALCSLSVRHLGCDRVYIRYYSRGSAYEGSWGEVFDSNNPVDTILEIISDQITFAKSPISLPLLIHDIGKSRTGGELIRRLKEVETKSCAVFGISHDQQLVGWVECHFRSNYHKWRKEDVFLLQQISEYCTLYVERSLSKSKDAVVMAPSLAPDVEGETSDELYRERLLEARQQYRRVLEYGNLIIVRTNEKLVVTDALGDTDRILGVTPGELMSDMSVWSKFLPARELRTLIRRVRGVGDGKRLELNEEIRVVNRRSNEVKWLMLKGVPLYSAKGRFLGWEGFAVDISDRQRIQEELVSQSKRIEALYEISKSLNVTMDPSVVALRGLRALIRATGSDCGFSCLVDKTTGQLELVAAEGFTVGDVDTLESILNSNVVLKDALEERRGAVIENIQKYPQSSKFGSLYFLKSAIVMPLLSEEGAQGLMVLFSRREGKFSEADFNLASVATGQICFVLNQAEYYANEKRQSDALAFLYKLSHALSQHSTAREIAEHAFPIIQEEIACKRMWMGAINEQQTHIIGQAGFGPGMRRHVVRVQIELDLKHEFLDEALKKKQPVIVRAGQRVECSGLNRIIQKLRPGTFIIVPLVSLGQVIGILILEPAVSSPHFAQRKLPLLVSMANEIGSVILARRFETKIADAEKMRMAGLLASGVAHNFNNLLQAVMGQASLIEVQVPEGSPLAKSARMIIDAAGKGASLISHLMTFTAAGTHMRKPIVIDKMFRESIDVYKSLIGMDVSLEMDLDSELPELVGDYSQLQRVMTNLLVNAKEAVSGKADGSIRISARKVRVRSGEVDPELAPGNYIRIDVADNGKGMDAEKQARCFEPFFTTKYFDSGTGVGYSGSGLGLSSAYSTVKQHEGVITVRSSPGKGAVFSVYLPVGRSESSAEQLSTEETIDNSVKDIFDRSDVMVYGLEGIVGSSIKSSLDASGVAVHIERNRRALVQFSRHSRGRETLIVVDADREEVGILELIRAIRSENPEIKLVVTCIDARRWSNLVGSLGPMRDIEIVEKTMGVWAIQSTVRRMLGVKKREKGLQRLKIEKVTGANGAPISPGDAEKSSEDDDEESEEMELHATK